MGEILKFLSILFILTLIFSGIGLCLIIKGSFEYIISKNILESKISKETIIKRGTELQENEWIKLAVLSFAGILISFAIVALTNMNMNASNTCSNQPYLQMYHGAPNNINNKVIGSLDYQYSNKNAGTAGRHQPMCSVQ